MGQGSHPSDDLLRSHHQGRLTGQLVGWVAGHLKGCPTCRGRLASVVAAAAGDRTQPAPGQSATVSFDFAASASTAHDDDVPPELLSLSQYEVRHRLGRGGMGVVYLAWNKAMGRAEALKIIPRDLLGRPGVRERFEREVRAAGQLDHPNVATAYSAFPAGDLLVFAMQYIEGRDLANLVRAQGPLPVDRAVDYVHQAALGLQHAHEKKMVHRDIKPQNLMVTDVWDGRTTRAVVKVLDFGLAKAGSEDSAGGGLTASQVMLGTPDYMAPEQAHDAQKADIRADIYGLGCTLHFLLTGQPPFGARSVPSVLLAHQTETPRPVDQVRADVPRELAAIVARMLAKEPARRYRTPADVARALDSVRGHRARRSRMATQGRGRSTQPRPTPPNQRPGLPTPNPPEDQSADSNEHDPRPFWRRWGWGLGALAMTVVALALVAVVLPRLRDGQVPGEAGPLTPPRGTGNTTVPERPEAAPWVGTKAGDDHVVQVGDQEVRFRWCPPGTFLMGSPATEVGRFRDEDQVTVTLTRGCWLMETEVPQGLWRNAGGPPLDWTEFGSGPDLPVYNVGHAEAEEFSRLLTRRLREGGQLPGTLRLALPTEAQWEFAARAGSRTRFFFGDDTKELGEHAWFGDNSDNQVHPVGTKRANAWGLRDMVGNVAEWCADGYAARLPGGHDPRGPTDALDRVARGGSWSALANYCRSANRGWFTPEPRPRMYRGLRLAAVRE